MGASPVEPPGSRLYLQANRSAAGAPAWVPFTMKGNLPMNAPPTDLRKLSRILAGNNLRVMNFLEGLAPRIDKVVEASFEGDWEQVDQVSQLIARYSELRGFSNIAHSANAVSQEVQGSRNEGELRRRILTLVADCGKERKAHQAK